jgi:hypothetical protein
VIRLGFGQQNWRFLRLLLFTHLNFSHKGLNCPQTQTLFLSVGCRKTGMLLWLMRAAPVRNEFERPRRAAKPALGSS